MSRKIALAALAATCALCQSAPLMAQQPLTLTISSEVEPIFEDGDLSGCAFNFEVGRQDTEFNRGELVYLTGSLNYYTNAQTPVFALKLGVMDTIGQNFRAPAEAYLVAGNETNAEDFSRSMAGEEQGFRIFVFQPGEVTSTAAILKVVETGRMTFAYSIQDGGRNAIVPVEFRNKLFDLDEPENSIFDEGASHDWINCLQQATEAIPE